MSSLPRWEGLGLNIGHLTITRTCQFISAAFCPTGCEMGKKISQNLWHPRKLSNSTLFPQNGTEATPSRFILESCSKEEWEFKVLCLCALGFNVVVFFLFLSLPLALDSSFSAVTQQTRPSAFRPCSKLTESRSAHDQPTAQNSVCVSAHNCTANPMQPCLPVVGLHLGFLHFPYSSIKW